eukprot:4757439-Amphidinium_carterae.2
MGTPAEQMRDTAQIAILDVVFLVARKWTQYFTSPCDWRLGEAFSGRYYDDLIELLRDSAICKRLLCRINSCLVKSCLNAYCAALQSRRNAFDVKVQEYQTSQRTMQSHSSAAWPEFHHPHLHSCHQTGGQPKQDGQEATPARVKQCQVANLGGFAQLGDHFDCSQRYHKSGTQVNCNLAQSC